MKRHVTAVLLLLLAAAPWPATAGTWARQQLLGGEQPGPTAQLGAAVAVAAEVIAVGAHGAYGGAGAVHLFRRGPDGDWVAFTASPLRVAGASRFGFDVALSPAGDRLLVGAPGTGGCGAAFLYQIDAGGDAVQRLERREDMPPLPEGSCRPGDELGSAVAAGDDDLLAVGARGADRRAGRVYVSEGGAAFRQLRVEGLAAGSELGQSLATDGRWLVAGAPSPFQGTRSPGAAYVVAVGAAPPTAAAPVALATSSLRAGDAFGYAVAVSGDSIVVGAPFHGDAAGAAFAFDFDAAGGRWVGRNGPVAAGREGDQLGVAVALDGQLLLAGARYAGGRDGAAYLYGGDGVHALEGPGTNRGQFGFAAGLRDHVAVVGAFQSDGGAGAAYAFEPLPSLRLEAPASVLEDAGKIALTLTATTEGGGPARRRITAGLEVLGGATAAGSDLLPATAQAAGLSIAGSFDIPPGATKDTLEIEVAADTVCEADEAVAFQLVDLAGAEPAERVTVTILNDDPGAIVMTPGLVSAFEDGTPARLEVVLACPPRTSAVVSLAVPGEEAGLSRSQLTFTRQDWNRPQAVQVIGRDDEECTRPPDLPARYTVAAASTSTAPVYVPAAIAAETQDDDLTCITGTMSVCSYSNGTVVYEARLENLGTIEQGDMAARNEFFDALPPAVTVVAASASRGVATVDFLANTVAWNGSIPRTDGDEDVVEITIIGALDPVPAGVLVINDPARLTFDRDRRRPIDVRPTDGDPDAGGPDDPAAFIAGAVCGAAPP